MPASGTSASRKAAGGGRNKRARGAAGHSSGTEITAALLRSWPLPLPDSGGDKAERGRALIIGGARELPGTMVLAATAALRSGAGKVQIATGRSIAIHVALAMPESRVVGLPESATGAFARASIPLILERSQLADAVLIGPGMNGGASVMKLLETLIPQLSGRTVLLDATALDALTSRRDLLKSLEGRAIITPHEGEMKRMLGLDVSADIGDRRELAQAMAAELEAVVVLKGAETIIATPGGEFYINTAGNSGLAVSGSGDTLSGLIAGLAARRAEPIQAAVWGVYLHARAGEILAGRIGPLGYLSREIAAEIPGLLNDPSFRY